jgi:hypothetical protein
METSLVASPAGKVEWHLLNWQAGLMLIKDGGAAICWKAYLPINTRKMGKNLFLVTRWFRPTPGRLLVVLLTVEGILFLLNWLEWTPKGWAVLLAIAAVAVTVVMMLLWFALALVFRWRFQFSIRSLLLLTVAVAISFSWLAVTMRQAKLQRNTYAPLLKFGSASYDFESDDDCFVSRQMSPTSEWILHTIGSDFLGNVSDLDLSYSTITDDDLKPLEGLEQLRGLWLKDTRITDSGLEHFEKLNQLKFLCVDNIVGSTNKITDAGLKHLEGLKQLKYLFLDGTDITDAGLRHLKGLQQLRNLGLRGTQITGVGLKQIKGLEQLRALFLDGAQVTDVGLVALEEMTQLQDLDISKTHVTDVGLDSLKSLKNLRHLSISNTEVTVVGVAELQKALPDCVIVH